MQKNPVYIVADNIITPLGTTTEENFLRICEGVTAIKQRVHSSIGNYYASKLEGIIPIPANDKKIPYTRIEQLFISSILKAFEQLSVQPDNKEVLFVLSSTKGNIEQLTDPSFDKERLRLGVM